ncbi:MobA/MobL family protein [Marilutibacter aestuarii]|uniref:Plasmid mobilization protein n=1 Tax=Marilutibacter aestuarii TaxID=1706195 RepID=A0A508A0B8_9GAMM|nr:MobA/MobL family protein [Lysobacter aestuarii]TQD39262.1 plasmid mobilization protein [Lysobacter aestuarii]
MATFHFEIKSGRKGTAGDHANYIARKGFHGKREDLMYAEHGNLPAWAAGDPSTFWRAADKYERKNGAVYREAIIALPSELTDEENVKLTRALVRQLTQGKPHQAAVHGPTSSLEGAANPHVHLMMCDRVDDGVDRPPERFFSRYNRSSPAEGGRRKVSGGRNRMELRNEVIATRKLVAETINHHLELNGHSARVDHRTLREQGVDRRPERHLGPARIGSMSTEEKTQYIKLRSQLRCSAR